MSAARTLASVVDKRLEMRTNKPSIHAFYFTACVIALAIEGVLSYVAPWPLNFAIVFVPAVALLTYLFWPWRMG